MKVLVNAVINVSELDGWCAEAYTPEVGWALGDGREHGDDPAWDAAEAEWLPNFNPRPRTPSSGSVRSLFRKEYASSLVWPPSFFNVL